MARKVTIELTSNEDIKLRGMLEDIRDGAKNLAERGWVTNDQVFNIGENILCLLGEIQEALDY